MASPPPPEGSSRTSGGILRGKAIGNTFNYGDGQELPMVSEEQEGVVKLFNSLADADANLKPLIIKTKVVPTISPVLKKLARRYSPIESKSDYIYMSHLLIKSEERQHILVLEDGQWNMKGRYDIALEDDEEVQWTHEDGRPSLTLCVVSENYLFNTTPSQRTQNATNPLDVPRAGHSAHAHASGSGSGSASVSASVSGPTHGQATAELSKEALVALLNIDEKLVTDSKNIGIKQHYERYKACLEAQQNVNEKFQAGTWPGKKPTSGSIIHLFASKTTWFTYMVPAFCDINNYPDIKEWLEGQDGCPTNLDIWGKDKLTYTFSELKEVKERRNNSRVEKERRKKEAKRMEGSGTKGTGQSKKSKRHK